MHLQTIIHSVAIFGIENAAAHVSGQPRKIHSKAQFAQNEPVFRIARRMLSLTRRARPGRSCFLYRNSLPHPAKPVKHFYVILQKIIPTSQSASQTAPLIGEPLAGRASPAVRVGPMGRKAAGPVLFGNGIRIAAVNLGSGARPFPEAKNFARSAQSSPTRQRLPYQGSWRASARLRGFFLYCTICDCAPPSSRSSCTR